MLFPMDAAAAGTVLLVIDAGDGDRFAAVSDASQAPFNTLSTHLGPHHELNQPWFAMALVVVHRIVSY